jgi:glycosyltransferase involved in cell wall biosynthesis
MKIAFIIPYVPNQIRTRSYNLINHVARLGHDVTLFTLGSSSDDFSDAEHLRAVCKDVHYHIQPTWRSLLNCVLALPSRKPLQSVYSWNPGLAEQLRSILRNGGGKTFDVVHVEHLRGSEYGVFLKSTFHEMPVVWDSVDCISHLFEQSSQHGGSIFGKIITRFELGRTRRAEGDLTSRFDRVLVTSVTDAMALTALVPSGRNPAPISVLPNGVDLDYFKPNSAIKREPATLVFSGKMSYHANISMVRYLVDEVMPEVWASRPETRLVIVGKDPPSNIGRLPATP